MKILKLILNSEFKNPKIPKIIFGFAATVAVFFLAMKGPSDPDLFWHLKTGELMWQYKTMPQVDWYSYTMNDFRWIDHEWLTEIMMFKIKDAFGWPGLAIISSLVIAFVFLYLVPRISSKPGEKNYNFYASFILTILGVIVSSLTFGIRPQALALLGIALIFFILKRYRLNNKSRVIYLLPFLFLLWANMHGSFAVGLGLLAIYLALDKYLSIAANRNPKAEWLNLYQPLYQSWGKAARLGLLSFAATFINPYGPRIYEEVYRTFSDTYAANVIMEWLSPNFHDSEGMLFGFYAIFVFIILALIKKIDILSFVLLPLFLFWAFQAGRNIPIFVLVSLPFLIRSMEGFEDIFASVMRKKFLAFGLSALLIIYPSYLSKTNDVLKSLSSDEEAARIGGFPRKALQFLDSYAPARQKNMLNDYGWGGYIIYNSKFKVQSSKLKNENDYMRVFIDGRMAHWKTKDRHILKDYNDLISIEDRQKELIDKYKIEIIFLNKDNYLSRALSFNPEWKKIYSDDIARIYEKIE